MQCGIQFTISALARAFQNGLSIEYFVVYTTSRRFLGGADSARTTTSELIAWPRPLAVSRKTYSPGTVNVAVVTGALAFSKTTGPGPDAFVHTTVSLGLALSHSARPL